LDVNVEPVEAASSTRADQNAPTQYERLKPAIGIAEGLPSDFVEKYGPLHPRMREEMSMPQ